MTTQQNQNIPLPSDIEQSVSQLNPIQLAWLSGYCWAKANGQNVDLGLTAGSAVSAEPFKVTVLSASQTGNAKGVASALAEKLKAENIEVSLFSAKDYKSKNIANEKVLFFVTSTQGEGEPPEEAVVLHKFLNGKKAPKLDGLQFAVFGLGDTSYPNFCQAGKDFNTQFQALGGKAVLDRVDADLDFQPLADKWIEDVVSWAKEQASQAVTSTQNFAKNEANPTASTPSKYNKANPFPAPLLTNQKITARQSEKDVRHLEFDLEASDLHYQAGDALGVWFENDKNLVNEILSYVEINPNEQVELNGEKITIFDALKTKFEITQNTPAFVEGYAKLADNFELNKRLVLPKDLQNFVQNTPLVDLLKTYQSSISALELIGLLRPLTPRLYSISSSPEEVGEEVHLTVGVVRYEIDGKARSGGASSYLADRVEEDSPVKVFIEKNDGFRLPADNSKPIIMIGSGTGIAPFRAFAQQRAAVEAEGKNWLIFGNQHFISDFLYQVEWQQFQKDGYLDKISLAWSRDQAEKIYVQDKIREEAETLWQWLQDGASIYVCGDAFKMAKDVETALLDVIEQQGKLSRDDAEEYLNELREDTRYQRDVY